MTDGPSWTWRTQALGDLGGYELGDRSNVNQAMRIFRIAVGNDDAAQRAAAAAWKVGDQAIAERQAVFLAKIAKARAEGTPITEAWLYQVGRLDQLRAYTAAQYTQLGVVVDRKVTAAQRDAVNDPVDTTQRLLRASLGAAGDAPGITLDFSALDVDRAVLPLVGMLQNGAPLRDLTFSNLTLAGADSVAQALVKGATTGRSTRDIAAMMAQERNLTAARAHTIARTEVLRANRNASLATMRSAMITTPKGSSSLVKEWKWSAVPSACAVCVSLQGSVHPVTDDFQSHPNCRCAPVPVTQSWADLGFPGIPDTNPTVPLGDDWVARMSPDKLAALYGKDRAALIQAGYLKPSEMVRSVDRGRWGTQPRLLTVREAQGRAAARGYVPPAPKGAPTGRPVPPPPPPAALTAADMEVLRNSVRGPQHPAQAIIDTAKADTQGYLDRHQALSADLHEKVMDARRHTGPATEGEVLDIDAARAKLARNRAEWNNAMMTHRLALGSRADTDLAALQAIRERIPPAEGRAMLKALEAQERWVDAHATWYKQELKRRGIADFGAITSAYDWESMVRRSAPPTRAMREALAYNLPIRERLHYPQPTDLLSHRGTSTFGNGKQLARARELWEGMVKVADFQERTFGIRTGWSGHLQFATGNRSWAGVFDPSSGLIGISRDALKYADKDVIKLLTHELFHGISNGTGGNPTIQDHLATKGWEEGTVEMAAQHWNTPASWAWGGNGDPGYNTYGQYTQPLERIRGRLGMDPATFYTELITTPRHRRAAKVRDLGLARGLVSADLDAIRVDARPLGAW